MLARRRAGGFDEWRLAVRHFGLETAAGCFDHVGRYVQETDTASMENWIVVGIS